jgi:hypothetical protein
MALYPSLVIPCAFGVSLLHRRTARPRQPLETLIYLGYLTVILWRWLSQCLTMVNPGKAARPVTALWPGRACSCFWDALTGGSRRPLRRCGAMRSARTTRNEAGYNNHEMGTGRAPSVALK